MIRRFIAGEELITVVRAPDGFEGEALRRTVEFAAYLALGLKSEKHRITVVGEAVAAAKHTAGGGLVKGYSTSSNTSSNGSKPDCLTVITDIGLKQPHTAKTAGGFSGYFEDCEQSGTVFAHTANGTLFIAPATVYRGTGGGGYLADVAVKRYCDCSLKGMRAIVKSLKIDERVEIKCDYCQKTYTV